MQGVGNNDIIRGMHAYGKVYTFVMCVTNRKT